MVEEPFVVEESVFVVCNKLRAVKLHIFFSINVRHADCFVIEVHQFCICLVELLSDCVNVLLLKEVV